jgi:hypothetical protein
MPKLIKRAVVIQNFIATILQQESEEENPA